MKPGTPPKSEHEVQAMFFNWVHRNRAQSPNLAVRAAMELCFAVPNGLPTTHAQKAKSEGLEAGIPDILLCWPVFKKNGDYPWDDIYKVPGLCLETKFKKNDLSPAQRKKRKYFKQAGWEWVTYWSVKEGIEAVMNYLPYLAEDYIPPEYF